MPLIEARWLHSRATGMLGTLTSRITTCEGIEDENSAVLCFIAIVSNKPLHPHPPPSLSPPHFLFPPLSYTYSTSQLKVYVPFQENDRFTVNGFIKKWYYYGKETQRSRHPEMKWNVQKKMERNILRTLHTKCKSCQRSSFRVSAAVFE